MRVCASSLVCITWRSLRTTSCASESLRIAQRLSVAKDKLNADLWASNLRLSSLVSDIENGHFHFLCIFRLDSPGCIGSTKAESFRFNWQIVFLHATKSSD